MTLANIFLIILLISLNGFFVSVEFAAVASRRSRLDVMPESSGPAGRLVRAWLEDSAARNRLIAASQLGITVVSLALGAVGENSFEEFLTPYFESLTLPPWFQFFEQFIPALPLTLSLIIITGLHVVLGEQVPKVAVLRSPESFALRAAPVMNLFSTIFKGFVSLLDWSTRQVLSLLNLPADSHGQPITSLEELKLMVSGPDVQGVIEEPEQEMLSAVINFGELVVRQVCIPRMDIVAVEAKSTVAEALDVALDAGMTKLPVYEENLDQVTGIIHLRDMVHSLRQGQAGQQIVRQLVRETLYVPETISVNHLLHQFRARKMHIAIVLDEFGGTGGLVTLEDLLEKIIGEVQDPFDREPPEIQRLADGTALIEGTTILEVINEQFNLNLSDPYYDTIAGFILGKLGRIPSVGDEFEDPQNSISLRVEEMDHLRISRVVLQKV